MTLLAALALQTALTAPVHPEFGCSHLYALAHVQEPPATQDKQPQKLSKEEERHKKDIEGDITKGAGFIKEIEKELKFSENADYVNRVNKIGATLAKIAQENKVNVTYGDPRLNPFPYQFKVVQGEDINAFSVPGGYIYIYEGLIKFCESDDELAGVMAHEIAHASFRHYASMQKDMSVFDKLSIPLILAAILSRDPNVMNAVTASQYAAMGMQSGWSVKAETAADNGALQYIMFSSYNPVGILTFMERLAFKERNAPQIDWGIFQTHPLSQERANNIQAQLHKLDITVKRSEVSSSLRADVKPGDDGRIEVWFGDSYIHSFGGTEAIPRADRCVARLNTFFDSVPALYELSRSRNEVMGKGRLLFEILAEDLPPGRSTDTASEEALLKMRTLLYSLNFQLWKT